MVKRNRSLNGLQLQTRGVQGAPEPACPEHGRPRRHLCLRGPRQLGQRRHPFRRLQQGLVVRLDFAGVVSQPRPLRLRRHRQVRPPGRSGRPGPAKSPGPETEVPQRTAARTQEPAGQLQ